MLNIKESALQMENFLNTVYGNTTGYVYLPTKVPDTGEWGTYFFQWPADKQAILAFIKEKTKTHEVYFAPALFNSNSGATKTNVKGARAVWCEFDGQVPDINSLPDLPPPSIRIQSSATGHEHWYWLLSTFVQPYDLEKINRALTYLLDADSSGWDANQVLRPPSTFNHKRKTEVQTLHISNEEYSLFSFQKLPSPPPTAEAPVPESIPDVVDVIAKYPLGENAKAWHLFKKGMAWPKRSEGLMALGYYCAEMQMQEDEIFAILLNADERWGKFKGRLDQYKRLMEIVVRARVKYPLLQDSDTEKYKIKPLGFLDIIKSKVELVWTWEDFLHFSGYFLCGGPSGTGKSQFALQAAQSIALGKNFLGKSTSPKEQKILFFSLEMGLVEIKQFMVKQSKIYSKEEQKELNEKLITYPLGEPIYLTRETERNRIEQIIGDSKATGIFFDSLGSVTEKSLSDEENVKKLMDWNDHIRQRFNCFTWYVHHPRKATGDNKKPNKMSDLYGNQYLTARTTSIFVLWPTSSNTSIQVIPIKLRLAPLPNPFFVFRDQNLTFVRKLSAESIKFSQPTEEEKQFNSSSNEDLFNLNLGGNPLDL